MINAKQIIHLIVPQRITSKGNFISAEYVKFSFLNDNVFFSRLCYKAYYFTIFVFIQFKHIKYLQIYFFLKTLQKFVANKFYIDMHHQYWINDTMLSIPMIPGNVSIYQNIGFGLLVISKYRQSKTFTLRNNFYELSISSNQF